MDDDSAGFYADLKPFERFDDFVAFGAYAPLPDDWWIVIADVVGSTQAIREGRYKRVNMVGASAIMAALNVRGGTEIPYVFGGDGATTTKPLPPVTGPVIAASATGLENTVVVVDDESVDDEHAAAVPPNTASATAAAMKRKENL